MKTTFVLLRENICAFPDHLANFMRGAAQQGCRI